MAPPGKLPSPAASSKKGGLLSSVSMGKESPSGSQSPASARRDMRTSAGDTGRPGSARPGSARPGTASKDMRASGNARPLTASGHQGNMEPARYKELLKTVASKLSNSKALLPVEVQRALQELQAAINAATPCWGRLHMYLTQDVQVQRLQVAANRIEAELNANVKATKHYAQPELRADMAEIAKRLGMCKVVLPGRQLELISKFNKQCMYVPEQDALQPSVVEQAAGVVEAAITELHVTDEVLVQELQTLQQAARRTNAEQQPGDAACVRLLIAVLLHMTGAPACSAQQTASSSATTGAPANVTQQTASSSATHGTAASPVNLRVALQGLELQDAGGANVMSTSINSHVQAAAPDSKGQPSTAHVTSTSGPSTAEAPRQLLQFLQSSRRGSLDFPASARSSSTGGASEGQPSSRSSFDMPEQLCQEGLEQLASFIRSNARVRKVSLPNNTIGDAGLQVLLEAIAVQNTVHTLMLPGNHITDAGARLLAEGLRTNLRLTTLQLGCNDIGDIGAQEIASALQQNTTLDVLGLHSNRIGRAGCQALAAAMKVNSTLRALEFLPGNNAFTEDAKALANALRQDRSSPSCAC